MNEKEGNAVSSGMSLMFNEEEVRVSEEGLRRLAEVAQNSGFRIDEEARRLVEEGRSADYYLGYANGVAGVITLCRSVIAKLGGAADANPHRDSQTVAGEHLVMEVIELITMRAVAPAAVAAEHYVKARGHQ